MLGHGLPLSQEASSVKICFVCFRATTLQVRYQGAGSGEVSLCRGRWELEGRDSHASKWSSFPLCPIDVNWHVTPLQSRPLFLCLGYQSWGKEYLARNTTSKAQKCFLWPALNIFLEVEMPSRLPAPKGLYIFILLSLYPSLAEVCFLEIAEVRNACVGGKKNEAICCVVILTGPRCPMAEPGTVW